MKYSFKAIFLAIAVSLTPNSVIAEQIYSADLDIQDNYILGPGDKIRIEVENVEELSATSYIGPDGYIYVPRIRSLYAEGLTIDELRRLISQRLQKFVKQPIVYVDPIEFRTPRFYVSGEVQRPGLYQITEGRESRQGVIVSSTHQRWPRLFDALQLAEGVTPYSDLKNVTVIRRLSAENGSQRAKTNIDFSRLLMMGDESVNIRLFDGDTVIVGKSDVVIRDQLIAAAKSSLSSASFPVFVTGRVGSPGAIQIRQGGYLNQALAIANPKLLKGTVEFIRLKDDGDIDHRRFWYTPGASSGSPKNPYLMEGDIIRVNESILSTAFGVVDEVAMPALGVFSIMGIFGVSK